MNLTEKAVKWIQTHSLEITSLFVAALALFTTIYQAELTRKHNRLSVVPIVYFSSDETGHVLSLVNDGMGPGIIQDIEVSVGNRYFLNVNVAKLQKIVAKTIDDKGLSLAGQDFSLTAGEGFMVIKPGESVSLLELRNEEKSTEFVELIRSMEFAVCYKSVYDDHFFIKSSDFQAPDDSCNYNDSVKIFGKYYRFHRVLDEPLNQTELLGNQNANKAN